MKNTCSHDRAVQELASRIQSYELAFRMQSEAPEAVDLSQETQRTLEMYGVGNATHGRIWA